MPKQDHRRIGIVGLGVGTIAIYGKPTDRICFYEINPEVERLARKYFTYLSASKANVQILLGDARLTLENQPPQQYDVLVLDAFSSDSVPVHLLTKEAVEIYLKQLGNDGILAFHISSNHLNLKKVVWRLAEEFQLHSAWIECDEDPQSGTLSSDWILLSRNAAILDTPAIVEAANPPVTDDSQVDLWTDDHMNLLQILRKKTNNPHSGRAANLPAQQHDSNTQYNRRRPLRKRPEQRHLNHKIIHSQTHRSRQAQPGQRPQQVQISRDVPSDKNQNKPQQDI
jgi:hypothetical protein